MFNFFILLVCILISILLNPIIPLDIKLVLYTVSLNIKEILIFILPWMIALFVFNGIIRIRKNSTQTMLLLLASVCISNFISTWIAYSVSNIATNDIQLTLNSSDTIKELWLIKLPCLISAKQALLLGVISGVAFLKYSPSFASKISNAFERFSQFILKRFISPIVPIFILGFLTKIAHDSTISTIILEYSSILKWYLLIATAYLVILYFFIARLKISEIMNIFPAIITAFATMSSSVALPLIINGTEKNIKGDASIAKSVLPPLVNFHLLGDCLMIPLISFGILSTFNISLPSVQDYFLFSLQFVIAKFAVMAIPSGGIIVMLPILATQFSFDQNMLGAITAIYALLDPIITVTNVLGNCAFVIIFNNIYSYLFNRGKKI